MNNSLLGMNFPASEQAGEFYDPLLAPIRSHLNPLRSLTMQRATSLLEMSLRGYYADLTWLYAHVERREHVMASLVERRQSTLGQCIWSIDMTEKAAKDESVQDEAKKQQEFLYEIFSRIDNLKEAWKWLGMAKFRGFAHLEKHYDKEGENAECIHLEPVPQWFWCRNWPNMRWLFNGTALQTNHGDPIDTDHFVIRECASCLGELAVFDYIRKALGIKDWGTFCSTFGIPNIFLECVDKDRYPSDTEMAGWLRRLQNYVSNGRGVLPPGMKANLFGGGSSDSTPFPGMIEYLDQMLVLAGTGGKLTMLSDSTGIGQGATGAHERVWEEIAAQEGEDVAEILHRSIGEPRLKEQFPGQPIHVRFCIKRRDQVDQQAGADLLGKLKNAGWKVNEEEAEKITGIDLEPSEDKPEGIDLTEPDDMTGSANNRARKTDDEVAAEETIVRSLAPVMNRLMSIMDLPDESRANALGEFIDALPGELAKANLNGESADRIEKMLVESVISGLGVEKGT